MRGEEEAEALEGKVRDTHFTDIVGNKRSGSQNMPDWKHKRSRLVI